jgi:hypothetical protein
MMLVIQIWPFDAVLSLEEYLSLQSTLPVQVMEHDLLLLTYSQVLLFGLNHYLCFLFSLNNNFHVLLLDLK